MSRNPYAHPEPEPIVHARVSALAVSSIVFSLLCCIPGFGLIGAILGGAGIVRISGSRGRLSGRTLAFFGLVLGLLGTVLWLALAIGAQRAGNAYMREVVQPALAATRAVEAKDFSPVRQLLDPKVAETLTDQDIAAFRDALLAEAGAIKGMPSKLNFEQIFNQPKGRTTPSGNAVIALPLPVEFDKSQGMIILETKRPEAFWEVITSGGTLKGALQNFGVAIKGKEFWLVPQPAPSSPAPPKPPPT
ncbi:MAG: hypothetical protein JNM80_05895 [Phycisphaerae bacterium]|nr:hypothetical protein [Phycisphaerae bacterium]